MSDDGTGMMMSSSMMMVCCVIVLVIAAGGAYWYVKKGGGAFGGVEGVEEEVSENMGKEPTLNARCAPGQHIRGIYTWTGDWNDVAGLYAECVDPRSGNTTALFKAGSPGVEGETGVAGKTGVEGNKMQQFQSTMTGGLQNDGGKGFLGAGISDADQGFTQLNVVYSNLDGFVYDFAGKTADGRTFYKLQQGDQRITLGNSAKDVFLGGIGGVISAITGVSAKGKIAAKWSQYNAFVRKHAPSHHFPLEFGAGGQVVKGKQPDITSWSQGCAQGICHKRAVCPTGKVITGIDVSIGNGVTRGFRVVCGKSNWK